MRANSAPMSVADYCNDLNTKKIVVNEDYQRQHGIWSPAAKSYFIESIILEYPIPKLYLYARLDLKTRATIKEIVDGQQRSRALQEFFNDKLRLSKTLETEELKGKRYNELDDEYKARFLSYSLPLDQFSGVPEDDVQEAFRRMNANNVPLNAEEQRNARYQGPFKWLIIGIAKDYRLFLSDLRLFSKRDILRMVDLKQYSEILYVVDQGFSTVKSAQLDRLYKKFNDEFSDVDQLSQFMHCGIDAYIATEALHSTPFLRGHVFQSIVLALLEARCNVPLYEKALAVAPDAALNAEHREVDLETLANSLSDPEAFPQLSDFIQACTVKTNVGAQKAIRFLYFREAIHKLN